MTEMDCNKINLRIKRENGTASVRLTLCLRCKAKVLLLVLLALASASLGLIPQAQEIIRFLIR